MDPRNEEFIRLLEAAGWSQAKAARELHVSTAAISQICTGKNQPGRATLNLLKLIIAREQPNAVTFNEEMVEAGLARWERELLEKLRPVPPAQRQRLLEAFEQMIRATKPPATFGKERR